VISLSEKGKTYPLPEKGGEKTGGAVEERGEERREGLLLYLKNWKKERDHETTRERNFHLICPM